MSHLQTATAGTVRAAIEKYWVRSEHPESLLLLGARPTWDGPDLVQIGALRVRVLTARSTLEVRDHLSQDVAGKVLMLTDVREDEIGRDVLARAVKQSVLDVGAWDMLLLAFGLGPGAPMDSNLARDGEVFARAVVDGAPAGGWPPPASGILTRDHVFRTLAHRVLGLQPERLDGAGILAWTLDPGGVLALRDQHAVVRTPLARWLENQGGLGTRPAIELSVRGDGTDALAMGVLAGLLWGTGGTGRAQGRFEALLGRKPTIDEVKDWAALSESWLTRQLGADRASVERVLRRAEGLARENEFLDDLGDSHWMPASLARRVSATAGAARSAVKMPAAASTAALEAAVAKLLRHQLAVSEQGDVAAVMMAARLARWVGTAPAPHEHLAEALLWQVREGGWVDRARQVLANGVGDPDVADPLRDVHEVVSGIRATIDLAAARHLATAVQRDQDPGSLVPVEDALGNFKSSTEGRSTLLIVVDGMSSAVVTEVAESVASVGWIEVGRDSAGGRVGLLAGLPTVTEVSRASLLAGKRTRGGQSVEHAGFSSVMGARSALFHKADLQGGAGDDLPVDVRQALQDPDITSVAVVLNSVDDALSKGQPGRTRWGVDTVTHLRALLERAGAAGRVVVLTSDHGHVVDQEPGVLRRADTGGGRWRADSPPAADGEVLLSGPRVQNETGSVVAAVTEGLRYRPRAVGYHGGAALAELAIPWMTFVRRGDVLGGFTPVTDTEPCWWSASSTGGPSGLVQGGQLF